jgi:heptosyltransferase I
MGDSGAFTTHRIPPNPVGVAHVQDQYFEFLRHIGVNPEPLEYGLQTSAEERKSQRRFFGSLNRPACAVVLATSDPRKNWTPQGYAPVLDALREDFGLQPILVGGLSPTESRMAEAIPARVRRRVVDARQNDLRRLLWLLEGSVLVISPDTGPLHIARAMEVPVVGLFGFTNPKRSGPYRLFQDLVVDGYARDPGEEYDISTERRPRGMERITAPMVLQKVELALRRHGRAPERKR